MTRFSVLMSLYAKEKVAYLRDCLASLQAQTQPADEIILVFDGPISSELKNEVNLWQVQLPLKVVELPENVGLGKALNEGLKYCSNEWVFRMDTDDICLAHRFEKQLAYIEANPDMVLLGGQVKEFDESFVHEVGIKDVPLDLEAIKKFALVRNPFNHMTVAYKKSIIEQVGGYQHHLYMEDYNLWLRVISKGYKVSNLPDVLVNVRAGNAMYARRKGIEYIRSEFQLAKLKIALQLQSSFLAYAYCFIRVLPRLLPKHLLGRIYQQLRKR
ncbi:glycosyltransferase [Actinobacillus minor]|uniref:glycosyltransferase n=1 Tax=Actinobacillus minor TaxID=51047 RepID=UPI0023F56765|nr:glycosyltransferase [Actinobacillus minor]MDD6911477.1 glycosyltransferase [Actinobacillus minor]MDY4712419.1 glycosyltransferase [Actinobacillus minor]